MQRLAPEMSLRTMLLTLIILFAPRTTAFLEFLTSSSKASGFISVSVTRQQTIPLVNNLSAKKAADNTTDVPTVIHNLGYEQFFIQRL